ncbi:MAG: AAA family ATPase [Actinobacteria bacterium]|nr:AAA family ATPase [Actinomycetota bacterium]
MSLALVGRGMELARVRESLESATAGHGGVVVLMGEAGIGKSRLAHTIATGTTERGLAVLQGRAVEVAAPAAYRPLAEALCSAVRTGTAPDPSKVGPFRSTLARLIPEWRSDDHGPLDESHVAVAEAVLRFLRATAADRGALVVLEDLHWADAETATIVDYLADNLATERVLCVVTVRDDPAGMALARSLRSRRAGSVLPLGPLDRSEVEAMVAACLRTNDLSEDVIAFAARADGVPFMVEELLAAAVSTGALVEEGGSWRVAERLEVVVPISLAESMRRRLRELGPQAEQVLVSAPAGGAT